MSNQMKSAFTVVRLDYSVTLHGGQKLQTHVFSGHRTLAAAARNAEKMQKTYNCIDVVDRNGFAVEWQIL